MNRHSKSNGEMVRPSVAAEVITTNVQAFSFLGGAGVVLCFLNVLWDRWD